jgi:hypothetical protein
MATWRVNPQLRIGPGQNLANKAFTVQTGPVRDLVLLDGPDALGGLAVYIAGFTFQTGNEPAPVINWSLYAGNSNIIDDEPVCAGSTFLVAGKYARQGLLFDVRGRDATTWLLRGYCTLKNDPYELRASVTLSPLPSGVAPLSITAGTVIG